VNSSAPFAAGRVDLHLHVLPGLDDGARDDDAALDMLRGLEAAGFSRLVATPHADDARYTYGPERIEAARAALESRAREAGLSIGIGRGAEYAYGARFHEELSARRLMTLDGSRYVLLELPEAFMPATMPNVLFEVGAAGYYPIVAHPERCQPFHDDLDRLLALTTGRALIQVSFRSLAGTFGRTIKKTAWSLVEGGHADLVATDCHSPRELPKIVRPVLAELEARLPPRRFQQLLCATPNRLIAAA
jgi:protein-tyrosine phosphatase